jgi:hypothetical protein
MFACRPQQILISKSIHALKHINLQTLLSVTLGKVKLVFNEPPPRVICYLVPEQFEKTSLFVTKCRALATDGPIRTNVEMEVFMEDEYMKVFPPSVFLPADENSWSASRITQAKNIYVDLKHGDRNIKRAACQIGLFPGWRRAAHEPMIESCIGSGHVGCLPPTDCSSVECEIC